MADTSGSKTCQGNKIRGTHTETTHRRYTICALCGKHTRRTLDGRPMAHKPKDES